MRMIIFDILLRILIICICPFSLVLAYPSEMKGRGLPVRILMVLSYPICLMWMICIVLFATHDEMMNMLFCYYTKARKRHDGKDI